MRWEGGTHDDVDLRADRVDAVVRRACPWVLVCGAMLAACQAAANLVREARAGVCGVLT